MINSDLIELTVLIEFSDYELLSKLKEEETISESDLRLIGTIFLESWRAYC